MKLGPGGDEVRIRSPEARGRVAKTNRGRIFWSSNKLCLEQKGLSFFFAKEDTKQEAYSLARALRRFLFLFSNGTLFHPWR